MATKALSTNEHAPTPLIEDALHSVRLAADGTADIGISYLDRAGRLVAIGRADPAGLEIHARQLLDIARDARAAARRAASGHDNVIPLVCRAAAPCSGDAA